MGVVPQSPPLVLCAVPLASSCGNLGFLSQCHVRQPSGSVMPLDCQLNTIMSSDSLHQAVPRASISTVVVGMPLVATACSRCGTSCGWCACRLVLRAPPDLLLIQHIKIFQAGEHWERREVVLICEHVEASHAEGGADLLEPGSGRVDVVPKQAPVPGLVCARAEGTHVRAHMGGLKLAAQGHHIVTEVLLQGRERGGGSKRDTCFESMPHAI